MLYARPLNPTLYHKLVQRFGERNVVVMSPGMAMTWRLEWPADRKNSRPARDVQHGGEEYLVPCPFCKDYKTRLTINHMWGVWDPDTRSENLWLMQCYNERCSDDRNLQTKLYLELYGVSGRRNRDIPILEGKPLDLADLMKEAQPPGPMTRLDKLAERHPHHHALQYLESRQFDPIALGKAFGVSYCAESKFNLARDKIIIPIYECGVMYGWQARYIGDNVQGQSFKEAGIPKYWTAPGTPKSIVGYNMEMAVRHQTILVVEGAADVWGAGLSAFGVLGKTMNTLMVKKLKKWISRYWKDEAVVVVLLDPDWDKVAKAKGKEHHIERAASVLRDGLGTDLARRVVPVYLPSGTDPGSLDRGYMREIIRDTAAEQGLQVRFDKGSRKPAVDAKLLAYDPFNKRKTR